MDIPSWLVALSAFILTVVVLFLGKNIQLDIRVFALSTIPQVVAFMYFQLFPDLPLETTRFINRICIVTANTALTFLILGSRKNG